MPTDSLETTPGLLFATNKIVPLLSVTFGLTALLSRLTHVQTAGDHRGGTRLRDGRAVVERESPALTNRDVPGRQRAQAAVDVQLSRGEGAVDGHAADDGGADGGVIGVGEHERAAQHGGIAGVRVGAFSVTVPAPTLVRSVPLTTPLTLSVAPLAAPRSVLVLPALSSGMVPAVRPTVPVLHVAGPGRGGGGDEVRLGRLPARRSRAESDAEAGAVERQRLARERALARSAAAWRRR